VLILNSLFARDTVQHGARLASVASKRLRLTCGLQKAKAPATCWRCRNKAVYYPNDTILVGRELVKKKPLLACSGSLISRALPSRRHGISVGGAAEGADGDG
jgi:hypothetical protein